MKFEEPIPVRTIAEWIDAKILGDADAMAIGINEIHKVDPGDIMFSDLEKYFQKSLDSAATIIILNKEVEVPEGKTILVVDEPFKAYDSIVERFRPLKPITERISSDLIVGEGTVIDPNVTIGRNVKIGKDCYIQSGAFIGDYTEIGDRVEIQAGAIIGTDAFYFKRYETHLQKWTTGGKVVLEDDVMIGAGSTVNRGVSGITRIGEGSKLDCLVHIGHGAVLGKHCLLAAQVGIGGKTIVGDRVVMYGQVGVAQNLVLGSNIVILAKSGVSKNLESGKTYFGIPAEEVSIKYRQLAAMRRLGKK